MPGNSGPIRGPKVAKSGPKTLVAFFFVGKKVGIFTKYIYFSQLHKGHKQWLRHSLPGNPVPMLLFSEWGEKEGRKEEGGEAKEQTHAERANIRGKEKEKRKGRKTPLAPFCSFSPPPLFSIRLPDQYYSPRYRRGGDQVSVHSFRLEIRRRHLGGVAEVASVGRDECVCE